MRFKSEVEIRGLNSHYLRVVCGSLKPEVHSEKHLGRGLVELECLEKGLRITIEAGKLSDLHAMTNSYIGLLKVSLDTLEVNL